MMIVSMRHDCNAFIAVLMPEETFLMKRWRRVINLLTLHQRSNFLLSWTAKKVAGQPEILMQLSNGEPYKSVANTYICMCIFYIPSMDN